MSYKKEYLDLLIEIDQLIVSENISENVLIKIGDYLHEIINLGSYSLETWNVKWRKEVYKFGELFQDRNASQVFDLFTKKITSLTIPSEIEVLQFIKSEIYINFFPLEESINYFEDLCSIYYLNPEFFNSLSILYQINDKPLSIKYLKTALKIEPSNKVFLDNLYHLEYGMGFELINEKKT